MMKKFEKIGKIMGLLLVGTALLFAGCMTGGGGSSSDDAVPADSQTSGTAIPMTFDSEALTLTIGDGEGMKSAVITGDNDSLPHTITLVNGTTVCIPYDVGGGDCWVQLVNEDTDNYMANTYLQVIGCPGCADAALDSADLVGGVPINAPAIGNPEGSAGIAAASTIVPVEICVAEDGAAGQVNTNGCDTQQANPTAPAEHKPIQIIAPGAAQAVSWKLKADSVMTPNYQFFAWVRADYFPYTNILTDPYTSIDPRYNVQDEGVFYVTVNTVATNISLANSAWLNVGARRKSFTKSGYGATQSNALTPIAGDRQYFAVNVAIDYPNRIESYKMGDSRQTVDYEYYTQYAFTLRYDPGVVEQIAGALKGVSKTLAGTALTPGLKGQCTGVTTCNKGKDTFTQYNTPGASALAGYGLIHTTVEMTNDSSGTELFTYWGTGMYSTLAGGNVNLVGVYGYGCAGHHGVARWNVAKVSCTIGSTDCIIWDGPDMEPEMPLAMVYMKLYTNPKGTGSEFWIDAYSGYTSFTMGWTNGSLIPSGLGVGSDDWTSYCLDPVGVGVPEQPCPVGATSNPAYVVAVGQEKTNPNIGQSGKPSIGAAGGWQQWPASIVVQ